MIKIFDKSRCAGVEENITKYWDSQVCAGVLDGSTDSCQGGENNILIQTKFTEPDLDFKFEIDSCL